LKGANNALERISFMKEGTGGPERPLALFARKNCPVVVEHANAVDFCFDCFSHNQIIRYYTAYCQLIDDRYYY